MAQATGQTTTPIKKINVTYIAPAGDSKVVEMKGTTFFDGIAVDVIGDEAEFKRLEGNPCFKINSVADYDPSEKTKADKEAADKAAPKKPLTRRRQNTMRQPATATRNREGAERPLFHTQERNHASSLTSTTQGHVRCSTRQIHARDPQESRPRIRQSR